MLEDFCFDAILWVHHVLQKLVKNSFASKMFISVNL